MCVGQAISPSLRSLVPDSDLAATLRGYWNRENPGISMVKARMPRRTRPRTGLKEPGQGKALKSAKKRSTRARRRSS
jgi:hypothetical protein